MFARADVEIVTDDDAKNTMDYHRNLAAKIIIEANPQR